LARLDVTDADVINDVERGLQALLADRMLADQQRPLGLATLEAILDAVDDEQRTEFLGHLRSAPPASRDEGDGVPAVFDVQQERDAGATPHVLHARIPAANFPQRAGNLLDALAAPVCSHRGPAGTDAARRVTQGAETVLEFEDFAELSDTALARIFRAADPQVALLALCGAGRDLVDRILGRLPLREARVLRRQIEQLGPTRLRDIESAQRRLAESAGRMADEGQIQIPGNRRFTVAA
jgi:flagellar motor switch protein FliG